MATLVELQTERERLRAEAARAAYQVELAKTIDAAPVAAATRAARGLLAQALEDLPTRLAAAIAGETDEARVHYLLSDAAIDWLRELGLAIQEHPDCPAPVATPLARGLRPRALLTVSQWADRYRFIETGTNAPGQWRTDRTPYLREPMDALSEHSPVRYVTFKKASGLGGTEVLYNWVGYLMHHLRNKDLLLVVPTLELRNRSLNPRLRKTFRETPALAEMVSTGKRDRMNRDDVIEYGSGARIIKAGANSPDSMRMEHLPYVGCDEVSAYPWDVGGEGDPRTLLDNRQRTYSRAKTYLVSTPTIDGECHISSAYDESDQRQYHIPCPHCGHLHPLEWKHFQYRLAPGADKDDPNAEIAEAWMVCPECASVIQETDKPKFLAESSGARWIPRRPQIKHHRGYHANALYAPLGLGLRWIDVARKWLAAQGDTMKLKSFINTYLGEAWVEQGESLDDQPLLARREAYSPETVPIGLITAGVDVQANRLEATVVGFGADDEAWTLDHLIIAGDTLTTEPWIELEEALKAAGVEIACVDSGFRTTVVRDFCRPRAWLHPTKGTDRGPIVNLDKKARARRLRLRRINGAFETQVGTHEAKRELMGRLKLEQPGPRYVHFPQTEAFDEEYFLQLTAEKEVLRKRRGRTFREWIQLRPRNEAVDCWILALVARLMSGRDPGEALQARQTATPQPTPPAPKNQRPRALIR